MTQRGLVVMRWERAYDLTTFAQHPGIGYPLALESCKRFRRFDFGRFRDLNMLVLSRRVGEKIWIGDKISVTVVRITGGGVRLGIDAPDELAVVREELKQKLENADCEPDSGR